MTGAAMGDNTPAASADLKGFVPRLLAVFAVFSALSILTNLTGIAARDFPDADDAMRLIQVRDLLAGQGWFDLHMHRVDAASGGVPMHWSRLVDIPLAMVILLLRPLIGQPGAELAALLIVPLFTFLIAMVLAGRLALRRLGQEAATFTCLVLALAVPVVSQMRPMRIDHHGWQIVLALAAVSALAGDNPRKGGWLAGLAISAWLAISIEGLPLAAAIMGLLALRWFWRKADKTWLISAMQGLAVGSGGLFLATRGFSDLAQHCDAVSPVYLAIFAWGAAVLTFVGLMGVRSRIALLAGFAATGAGAVAILMAVAPQCRGGGFAALDPLVHRYWYLGIAEGLPIWRQPLSEALQVLVPSLLAIWAAFSLARKTAGTDREFWAGYTLLLIAALAVAIAVARAGAVAAAFAAVPLGWQVAQWLGAARRLDNIAGRVVALLAVALALLPAMPATLLAMGSPSKAGEDAQPRVATIRSTNCNIATAAAELRKLPKGEFFAPLDIGPQLLYETGHRVVATSHHRGSDAMRQVISGFLGPERAAHELLRARASAYVAICPDLAETAAYARAAPQGFAALLIDGKAPAWLEPVAMPQQVGLRVWKVR